MEYFFRREPFDDDGQLIKGYRLRIMQECKEHEITEPRLCDQARTFQKNGWLFDLEFENIRRMMEAESDIVNESIEDVEENRTEKDNNKNK